VSLFPLRPRPRPSPRRVPAAPQFAALVRNDLGGLEARRFTTAADAAKVALDRELPTPAEIAAVAGNTTSEIRHTEFARRLGLSPRLVREQYKRGGLPGAKEHSAYILMVPTALLRLARTHGLRRVERMHRAGLISLP